jgi:hypothetical protein
MSTRITCIIPDEEDPTHVAGVGGLHGWTEWEVQIIGEIEDGANYYVEVDDHHMELVVPNATAASTSLPTSRRPPRTTPSPYPTAPEIGPGDVAEQPSPASCPMSTPPSVFLRRSPLLVSSQSSVAEQVQVAFRAALTRAIEKGFARSATEKPR